MAVGLVGLLVALAAVFVAPAALEGLLLGCEEFGSSVFVWSGGNGSEVGCWG